MSQDIQVSIRLSTDIIRRADEMAKRMREEPVTRHLRPTRAAVLRMALETGLDALDQVERDKG